MSDDFVGAEPKTQYTGRWLVERLDTPANEWPVRWGLAMSLNAEWLAQDTCNWLNERHPETTYRVRQDVKPMSEHVKEQA